MTLEMGNNFSYFKKTKNTLSSFCTFHRCFILHTRMFAAEHLHVFKQSVCFQEAGSREVLSGGTLNSAGSWGPRMGQVAAQCHASKNISLRALLRLWQCDSLACSSLLFGGCGYLTAHR